MREKTHLIDITSPPNVPADIIQTKNPHHDPPPPPPPINHYIPPPHHHHSPCFSFLFYSPLHLPSRLHPKQLPDYIVDQTFHSTERSFNQKPAASGWFQLPSCTQEACSGEETDRIEQRKWRGREYNAETNNRKVSSIRETFVFAEEEDCERTDR